MAAQVGRTMQDQNLNVHFDGASVKGKTNGFTQKKGGLGGRKALNDISNSGKPSMLQASKKHNINVISTGEDLGASKSIFSAGLKTNVSKANEKVQVGVRKALSDLTNSGKPSMHQASKKLQDKKLIAVAEEENLPDAIAQEGFLHSHQECVKAQRKAMDMHHFLKTVGLDTDMSMQLASPRAFPLSRKSKPDSPLRNLDMEEMSELLIEGRSPQINREGTLPSACNSPTICGTPKSPSSYMHWKEYNIPNFVLMQSPELMKR